MPSRRKTFIDIDTSTASNSCRCPDWLVDAWDELVHRSPVRAGEIAELMGVHVSTLYNFATKPTNPSGHHRCALPWHIVPAAKASQNPVVINVLAQHAGLSTPHPRQPSDESPSSVNRQALKQIITTLQEITDSMPDGPIDAVKHQRLQYSYRRLRDIADQFTATTPETNLRPLRRAT